MSYTDFLNTMLAPIRAFIGWCETITTALIQNYVFITAVGLIVAPILIHLFIDHVLNFSSFKTPSKKHDLDNGGKK